MAWRTATVRTAHGKFGQTITIGPHTLTADVPVDEGGDDKGLEPHDFLLAGLGTCTSMTIKLYADRKGWPLKSVEVRLAQEKKAEAHEFHRSIVLNGDLNEEQRAKLLEIANKCPVHKTLTGTIRIQTELAAS
jgi:putative redox protein